MVIGIFDDFDVLIIVFIEFLDEGQQFLKSSLVFFFWIDVGVRIVDGDFEVMAEFFDDIAGTWSTAGM